MADYFKRKFALSNKGAKDLIKAIIACTLTDISFMLPVAVLYFLIENLVDEYLYKNVNTHSGAIYIVSSLLVLMLIFLCERNQYNRTFLASYEESGTKRITIGEKLRKIPLAFFAKRDLSDLTTTIMGDCSSLEEAFSHYIPQLFASIITTVLVGGSLLIVNWKLALALLWVVPTAFILTYLGKNSLKKANKRNNDLNLINADSIQECIENIREIKSCNQQEKYLKKVKENLKLHEKTIIKSELNTAMYVVSSQMLLKVGVATMTLQGASLIVKGEVDFLTLVMFLLAASRVFDPLSIALQNLAAIFATEIKIDRMNEIEDTKPQEGDTKSDFNNYDICFKGVDFAYNNNEKVLNNVSFIAKQGEVTALVGPSGGGKSTVSKLAARFWDIDKGKITVGGMDISNIEPEELWKKYSIVFQDVVLFNNTVMENIRIGKKGASDADVKRAAKLACCDEFVKNLPEGYNTMIGENGTSLSGGERQRISIARALLKDAPIVLLDEVTSSLDVENESKVQRAISKLIENKTVLVIAHRMRTVSNADHIIVLKDGAVMEEGNHDKLINKRGIYNKLWTLQTKAAEWSV